MKGSVHYDRNSKRYFISVYWDGKRHKIFKHPVTGEPFFSDKSADKQLNRIRTEIDENYFNPAHWKKGNPLLVTAYAREWLSRIEISPNTRRGYKSAAENYIIPFLGDMDLRHVRYSHIVDFHKWISLTDKGKYNVCNVLKSMMHYAVKDEVLGKVPPFPPLSYQAPEIEYLEQEQQQAVLNQIPEEHRPIFQFSMEFGTRPSEARALKWDCVGDDIIVIKRTFSDNILKEYTKAKAIRYEPITDYIRNVLKSVSTHISGFVFTQNGKPYHQNQLPRILNTACKKVGIKIKLYNGTKHSLGCQMLNMDYDMDLVQEQCGHTLPDMTRRYAKRKVSVRAEALEARRNNIVPLKRKVNSQ